MSDRIVPFHCPYCGEEDLRPHLPSAPDAVSVHGQWECRACLRAFSVKFLGLLPRTPAEPVETPVGTAAETPVEAGP